MDYERCYFDKDLRIYYVSRDEHEQTYHVNANDLYKSFYRLIYIQSAKASVQIGDKSYLCREPALLVAKPNLDITLPYIKQPYQLLYVYMHPSLLRDVPNKDKLFDFFYKLHDKQLIFGINDPRFSSLKTFIDIIQTALFARCGRFSIETRAKALITELSLIYESVYTDYIKATDSIPAQIMDYIDKHYLENIKTEDIAKKFSISYNTLNSIFKTTTGSTFKKYITRYRLTTANTLMSNGNYTVKEIANLSGFTEYAAFLKAYKKMFGVVPSKRLGAESNAELK